MSVELPKDAEGREIPLDTVALYDDSSNVHNVRRFMYTNDFDLSDKWINSWIAVVDDYKIAKPEQMYLNKTDSWEKLEEDIRRIGTDDCTWFCGYANENPVENVCLDSCKFFKGDEITCRKKLADDILSRIRRLRGEN